MPDGGCAAQTGDIKHWLVAGVAHPDTGHKLGGVAYRPVIMKIGSRTCFDRSGTVELESAAGAKAGRAGFIIAENIRDQPGHALIQDAGTGNGVGGVEHFSIQCVNFLNTIRLHSPTAIRKSAIRSRKFQQAHRTAAQGDGEIIIIGVIKGGDTQVGREGKERFQPDVVERGHGRDIERRCQGFAHQHWATFFEIIIAGGVGFAFAGDEGSAHIHQHGGRGEGLRAGVGVKSCRINQRFERRTGLTRREGHIHRPRVGSIEIVWASQHGKDFAGVRVEGNQSSVIDVMTQDRVAP